MSECPPHVRKWLEDFYRKEKIERHRAELRSWPRWARLLHLLISWGCPACRAAKGKS